MVIDIGVEHQAITEILLGVRRLIYDFLELFPRAVSQN